MYKHKINSFLLNKYTKSNSTYSYKNIVSRMLEFVVHHIR